MWQPFGDKGFCCCSSCFLSLHRTSIITISDRTWLIQTDTLMSLPSSCIGPTCGAAFGSSNPRENYRNAASHILQFDSVGSAVSTFLCQYVSAWLTGVLIGFLPLWKKMQQKCPHNIIVEGLPFIHAQHGALKDHSLILSRFNILESFLNPGPAPGFKFWG